MADDTTQNTTQVVAHEWVSFPGGELEGQRPRALCPACRERLQTISKLGRALSSARARLDRSRKALCFQCYRAELERQRALKAAGDLNTASEARFQCGLPF